MSGGTQPTFTRLVGWLVDRHTRGIDELAKLSTVGESTIQVWLSGAPPTRVGPAVRTMHAYAVKNVAGYPPSWAPDGLTGTVRAHRATQAEPRQQRQAEPQPGPHPEPTESDAPPRRRRWRLLLLPLVLVGAAIAVTVYVLRPAPPPTAYGRFSPTVPIRSCPQATCETVTEVRSGTRLHLTCYTDTMVSAVNYPSNRWFGVQLPNSSRTVWIHSSAVRHQSRVGYCPAPSAG